MRYFIARLENTTREREYRNYVTDILRGALAPDVERYADLFKAVTTESAEDIKNRIKAKLRGLNGLV